MSVVPVVLAARLACVVVGRWRCRRHGRLRVTLAARLARVVVGLVAVAVGLSACGAADSGVEGTPVPATVPAGGGGNVSGTAGAPAAPAGPPAPASVAGVWLGLEDDRNPGEARLVGCSGALRSLERLLAAGLGPECVAAEPARVVQSGTAFTILRSPVTCTDGTVRGRSGVGTVDRVTLQGQLDLIGDAKVRTLFFTGTIDGNRVVLEKNRLEIETGLDGGSCLISPPLTAAVTVVP